MSGGVSHRWLHWLTGAGIKIDLPIIKTDAQAVPTCPACGILHLDIEGRALPCESGPRPLAEVGIKLKVDL